jgi:polyphosphate kinase 2 (PPK2 family)
VVGKKEKNYRKILLKIQKLILKIQKVVAKTKENLVKIIDQQSGGRGLFNPDPSLELR